MATAQVNAKNNESHPPARYVIGTTREAAETHANNARHTAAECLAIGDADNIELAAGDVVVAIKGQGDPSEPWVELGKRAQSIGAIVKGR